MMLKLSKMYLHVFAWLKCKIWEIQLRHQVLKCSDFISATKLIRKSVPNLRCCITPRFKSIGGCIYFGDLQFTFGMHMPVWFTSRGTQREILRKRPKNNNKAWIKISETILSILGDCWKKIICSSLPARLMEEFPASNLTTCNLTYWEVTFSSFNTLPTKITRKIHYG